MKLIFISFFLLIITISCQHYDFGPNCDEIKESFEVSVPTFVDSNKIYLVFGDTLPKYEKNKDYLPNSILVFDNLTDSLIILKNQQFEGMPLLIQKNLQNQIVIITSQCIYSLSKDLKLTKELTYNFEKNPTMMYKTLFDYNNDLIYLRPGIDNTTFKLFALDINNFSSELIENTPFNLNLNNISGFCFPYDNNYEYIFASDKTIYIKRSNDIITTNLPNNEIIYSISYNYKDKEICLGTNNGSIYYYNGVGFRSDVMKGNIYFPSSNYYTCNNTIVSSLNFTGDFCIYQYNNSPRTIEYYYRAINDKSRSDYYFYIYDNEYNNFNAVYPYYKGNLKQQFWDSFLTTIDSSCYHFNNHFNFTKSGFSLNKLDIDFVDKTIYIHKTNTADIFKTFEY